MKQQIIESIIQQMLQHLNNVQLQRLKSVLEHELFDCEIKTQAKSDEDDGNQLLDFFITAKRIEGCSEKNIEILSNHDRKYDRSSWKECSSYTDGRFENIFN